MKISDPIKRTLMFVLLTVAIIAIMVITSSLTPRESKPIPNGTNPEESYGTFVPLYKIAKKISIYDLLNEASTYNFSLYLPTKMPGNIKLIAIYYKPPVILFSYCDREVSDYRYDNITIETTMFYSNPPSLEELELSIKDKNNSKVINFNNIRGILVEKAEWGDPELQKLYGYATFATLWIDNHYYIISATPPTTSNQLIEIIKSFKPIKG